jgi:hypothetical protein
MNKSTSKHKRTRIADLPAKGPVLLDKSQLRLVVGGLPMEGTCLPGETSPGSYTNPGEADTATDQNFD